MKSICSEGMLNNFVQYYVEGFGVVLRSVRSPFFSTRTQTRISHKNSSSPTIRTIRIRGIMPRRKRNIFTDVCRLGAPTLHEVHFFQKEFWLIGFLNSSRHGPKRIRTIRKKSDLVRVTQVFSYIRRKKPCAKFEYFI